MPGRPRASALEVFSTCPASSGADLATYRQRVVDVARWCEESGCTGILVYSDNSQLDPWAVADVILGHTTALCPLIAIQPIYMHPYTVAKAITSIAALRGRRVFLNMVAGGFTNDLAALNDQTPHDKRYARLAEYTLIIRQLLETSGPVSFEGEFYKVDKLRLSPPMDPALLPGFLISGSSEAGLAAAKAIEATAIKYPKPAHEEAGADAGIACGIRVGIIAREDEAEAWRVALSRFPEDRKGQITRQLATKVSDSVWHKQLSALEDTAGRHPYWLVPFQNYKTMCPYLVGSYEQVGEEMGKYFAGGYRTVILDVPTEPEDLLHTSAAFSRALQPVQ
ncbi:MAG TPA: LLM class flavin-dependent oxidoreductase [Vicinamibacterales bacterium]|nr:LLM class flavin-dependent oxidoreductase [Vicinamibacterales bacterium]